MKKNLFFATLFVAGAATAGFSQFATERNEAGTYAAGSLNFQDTTKPVKDTTKPAQDTVPAKKDSTSFNF